MPSACLLSCCQNRLSSCSRTAQKLERSSTWTSLIRAFPLTQVSLPSSFVFWPRVLTRDGNASTCAPQAWNQRRTSFVVTRLCTLWSMRKEALELSEWWGCFLRASPRQHVQVRLMFNTKYRNNPCDKESSRSRPGQGISILFSCMDFSDIQITDVIAALLSTLPASGLVLSAESWCIWAFTSRSLLRFEKTNFSDQGQVAKVVSGGVKSPGGVEIGLDLRFTITEEGLFTPHTCRAASETTWKAILSDRQGYARTS